MTDLIYYQWFVDKGKPVIAKTFLIGGRVVNIIYDDETPEGKEVGKDE